MNKVQRKRGEKTIKRQNFVQETSRDQLGDLGMNVRPRCGRPPPPKPHNSHTKLKCSSNMKYKIIYFIIKIPFGQCLYNVFGIKFNISEAIYKNRSTSEHVDMKALSAPTEKADIPG